MPDPIRLTPELFALVDRIKAETARMNADSKARRDHSQIEGLRSLINDAVAAGLPTQAYISLQVLVGSYDGAMSMPPHLRDVSML